ncbi:MAG: HupE/UreJ family protein, partial [Oligoflexus sp.]
PETFAAGFLSGLAHPVIGMDHLSFILLTGLITFTITRRYLDPLLFLGLSLMGSLLQVYVGSLPGVEMIVALSVLVMLLMLWMHAKLARWSTPIMVVAGLFHGYAYGSAVVGTMIQPLVAYLIGFSLIQALLLYSFGQICAYLAQKSPSSLETVENIVSAVGSGVALVYIVRAF